MEKILTRINRISAYILLVLVLLILITGYLMSLEILSTVPGQPIFIKPSEDTMVQRCSATRKLSATTLQVTIWKC